MAANKNVTLGPQFIAVAAADIWLAPTVSGGTNPPPESTATYYLIRHIRIVNTDSSARTFTLYKGLTGGSAAGTEIMGGTTSIPANSAVDFYFGGGGLRVSSTETNRFISGIASVASKLVITAEAEIGIV